MNIKKGTFKTYRLPKANQSIIYTLFTSSGGTVWIGTDGGLTKYVKENDSFVNYDNHKVQIVDEHGKRKRAMPPYSVKSIAEDKQGRIFIGTWRNGVFRVNGKGNFVEYPRTGNRNSAYSLLFDTNGRLWIGTWRQGLYMIGNPRRSHTALCRRISKADEADYTFYKMAEDKKTGTIWACTQKGIYLIDENHPELTTYDNVKGTGNASSPTGSCTDICMDKNDNIRIESLYGGIFQISRMPDIFKLWTLPENTFFRHTASGVCAIKALDRNNVMLAFKPFGLAIFNRQSKKTLYNRQIPGLEKLPDNVLSTSVTDIIKRSDGEVWLANNSFGIIMMHPGRPATILSKLNTSYLKSDYVNCLYEARNHDVWIGSREGLSIARPDNSGIPIKIRDGEKDLSNCDVRGITEDRKGNMWVATDNEGIIRISGKPGQPYSLKFKRYGTHNGGMPVNEATTCFEDSRGRLWAISNSGGLFEYDTKEDRFNAVNEKYHIEGDRVFAITEDETGNLWFTTDHSLVRLSFSKYGEAYTVSFSKEDGTGEILFMPNVTCKWGKELFFGNRHGFFNIIPGKMSSDLSAKKPKLIVSDIIIDGNPYDKTDSLTRNEVSEATPYYTRKISIPSSVKRLDVEFALLSYGDVNLNKYAYKLEGYDNKWVYCTGQQNTASFQNLPSGNYELSVKAAGSNGIWTELPYQIKVKVLPPWYATWWAYLTYLTMAAGGITIMMNMHKRNLRTKNKLQMAVILTNITHELLTPLAIISAVVDEMRNKEPSHEKQYGLIQNNIQRTTRLLRQILEVRKAQAGKLKLLVERNDLAEFVKATCSNIMPLTGNKNSKMEVNVGDTPLTAWFDRDKVDKIIYNLLSNAFKYNKEGGTVSVSLTANESIATLKISDQGVGISKEKMKHLYTRFLDGNYRKMSMTGTGIGLSLTHDLVKLHHGSITCKSEENKGTEFTVKIPTGKDSYTESEIYENAATMTKPETIDISTTEKNVEKNVQATMTENEYSILIVEDNTDLLEIMSRMLSRKYNIFTAKDGRQAFSIIQKKGLDLVVSDVMMPVMDGMELTKAIRSEENYAHIPIILLTAKTTEEDRNEGYLTGADAYITKPFKMADLELRIDNIIANREITRRKFSSLTEFNMEEQHYSSPDEVFVKKAVDCVKRNLANGDYDRETFASDMCVSSSTLYNKLRAITGHNITGFINSIRLKEACRMIKANPDMQVGDLAEKVGFNSTRYFTLCFKKEFGMTVRELINEEHE